MLICNKPSQISFLPCAHGRELDGGFEIASILTTIFSVFLMHSFLMYTRK